MFIRREYIESYVRVREEKRLLYHLINNFPNCSNIHVNAFLKEMLIYESTVPKRIRDKFESFDDAKDLARNIDREASRKRGEDLLNLQRISPIFHSGR
jgi:hypothetical protein